MERLYYSERKPLWNELPIGIGQHLSQRGHCGLGFGTDLCQALQGHGGDWDHSPLRHRQIRHGGLTHVAHGIGAVITNFIFGSCSAWSEIR